MNTPALLHIGYIKTATTFLQNAIFSNEALGLGLPGGGDSRAHLVEQLVVCDPFCFDAAAAQRRFAALEAPLRERDLLPVWSDETLLGNPLTRKYSGHGIGLRIKAAFPDVKILITIRQQQAIALSMFQQYIKEGNVGVFAHFIGAGDEPISFTPILRTDHLMYDRAIDFYQHQYGKENVLVLCQEMLAREPTVFFRTLGDFIGHPLEQAAHQTLRRNVGLGFSSLRIMSFLNRFFVKNPLRSGRGFIQRKTNRLLERLDKIMPKSANEYYAQRYRQQIEARYAGLFAASNHRTADITGLDLEKWGYEIDP